MLILQLEAKCSQVQKEAAPGWACWSFLGREQPWPPREEDALSMLGLFLLPSFSCKVWGLWSSERASIPRLQLNPLQATPALSLRTDCRLDGALSTCQLLQHLLELIHLGMDPHTSCLTDRLSLLMSVALFSFFFIKPNKIAFCSVCSGHYSLGLLWLCLVKWTISFLEHLQFSSSWSSHLLTVGWQSDTIIPQWPPRTGFRVSENVKT